MTEERSAHRPSWLPTGCPSWCYPDCHSQDDAYDDRYHHSDPTDVTLTADNPAGATGGPGYLRVELSQHYRETEPRPHLARGEDPGIYMTLDEAEHVGLLLLAVVAAGRTGGPIVPLPAEAIR